MQVLRAFSRSTPNKEVLSLKFKDLIRLLINIESF